VAVIVHRVAVMDLFWGRYRLVQSRFAETRFAETPTLTLTLNPNFGESGFGESGRHLSFVAVIAVAVMVCGRHGTDPICGLPCQFRFHTACGAGEKQVFYEDQKTTNFVVTSATVCMRIITLQ